MLTVIATAVLLLKLAPISHLGAAASSAEFTSATLPDLRLSLLLHATGGLIILLAAAALAVYKPAGLTPFAADATVIPRWVKVCGAALILLLAVVLVMVLAAGHGPR